ncbi:efflux RND transporter periplasmic adaptor subunit [Novosphingobium piscinae]|uniref:efflux RND transporter periplasmic adaptor subunit n=1 Tax=Novosphingobium piscinae TaxID=1507448 RepID=UPI001C8B8F33|nr:efflux RND transporter periplasmic adaptor subunit [Novosphingobium piscinae]
MILALVFVLSGCGGGEKKKERPVPAVGFIIVTPTAVPMATTLGGRTVAFASSEVRPQVTGVIRARRFVEGGLVRQGQPLFEIDQSLYRAAVNLAEANLLSAQSTAEAAATRAERLRPLAKLEAVSQQEYTDASAQARQTAAAVAQARAQLETARINLRFTTVPAPITGRIGRALFTSGALVSANQVEPLAVIQQLDPIFVDVQESSADLLSLRRALASGGAQAGSTRVRLKLEDGSDYPLTGTVQFSEMLVNEATGTVTLRVRFPNPEGFLLPGMFVQATFDESINPSAYLVPQQAVQRDFGGSSFVYVVGPGNKAVRRKIETARTRGADWIVTAGLKPGDRVIIQGTANLKQGAPIRPVPASTPERIAPGGGTPAGAGR